MENPEELFAVAEVKSFHSFWCLRVCPLATMLCFRDRNASTTLEHLSWSKSVPDITQL